MYIFICVCIFVCCTSTDPQTGNYHPAARNIIITRLFAVRGNGEDEGTTATVEATVPPEPLRLRCPLAVVVHIVMLLYCNAARDIMYTRYTPSAQLFVRTYVHALSASSPMCTHTHVETANWLWPQSRVRSRSSATVRSPPDSQPPLEVASSSRRLLCRPRRRRHVRQVAAESKSYWLLVGFKNGFGRRALWKTRRFPNTALLSLLWNTNR